MRNYLALVLVAVIGVTAYAGEMPGYLKGATITVTLENGKTYEFAAEEYMVVKRHSETDVVVEIDEEGNRTVYQAPAMAVAGPNSIKAFGGAGPSGLKASVDGSKAVIDQDYGLVYGLGYSRQLNHRWSLEAVGLSNKTGLLGLGYSF